MAIRFLTDSTAGFTMEEGAAKGIDVVPLTLQFGEESYRDGIDLSDEEFYRMLAQAKSLPTTSQATPEDFLPYFERAKAAGDSVICLPLAAALSGTCQSARIARELCGYEKVWVVDSTQTVLGLRLLLDLGCLLRAEGDTPEEIAQALEEARGRVKLLAVVDTLEYLHRGGRLSASVALVGGLLKVKPIITLKDGALSMVGKGMGAKGSLSALVGLLGGALRCDERLGLYYGYTADETLCRELMGQVEAAFGAKKSQVHPVGAVIGTHVGPGAAALAYLEKK